MTSAMVIRCAHPGCRRYTVRALCAVHREVAPDIDATAIAAPAAAWWQREGFSKAHTPQGAIGSSA